MDYPTILIIIIAFVMAILFPFILQRPKPSKLLPPGPHPYPIIGNIMELLSISDPLQVFTHLSKTYGPIMTLKLGAITTIVISSPQIAKEALQNNDTILSSRTIPDTMASLEDHQKASIIWLPTSPKWRSLRRACATKIFSPQQLDSTQFIRKRKVQELLDYVHEFCNKGEALHIGDAIFNTVLNSISNTFLSVDFVHYDDSIKCQDLKNIIVGLTEEAGKPNIVDFFPLFRSFDPQGARAKTRHWYDKLFVIFDSAIEERIRVSGSKMDSRECKDVLDSLLELIKEENSDLTHDDVLHILMDLFVAGIDTTSSTMEWAMAELLHSPKKLAKVREELQQVLGKDGQLEEHSLASKLPYLNAVLKETLRLHPPAPLLVPHKSNDDVELGGFMVPKNAQILVNVWSIGRDSSVWNNPNLFEPERFLESEIDFKGKNFELIPFGAGRRICPGLPLAYRSMHFILASLLYHFNWKLDNEMKPEDMDMSYSYGITLHKAQPLCVVPMKI